MDIKPTNTSASTTTTVSGTNNSGASTGAQQQPVGAVNPNQAFLINNLKAGQIARATVSQVTQNPVGELSRQAGRESFTQGNASNPNAKSADNNSPALRALLTVNQGQTSQTLTVVTRAPLQVGQQIQVQANQDGSLQLLTQLPALQASQPSSRLLLQQALIQLANLTAGLSSQLQGQTPAPLLNRLLDLSAGIDNRPAADLNKLNSLLKKVLQNNPSLAQLRQPQGVKQAFLDSGVLLESKLATIKNTLGINQASNSSGQTAAISFEQRLAAVKQALDANPQLKATAERILGQDAKTQLNQLLQNLSISLTSPQALTGQTQASPASPLTALLRLFASLGGPAAGSASNTTDLQFSQLSPAAKSHALLLLSKLVKGQTPPQASQLAEAEAEQFIQQLKRDLLSALVKLHANQLNTQASQLPASEAQQQSSWFFDVPVYANQQYRNLQISIQEEEAGNGTEADEKSRVWKVTLGFDLEQLGEFYATLRVADDQVSTIFWSERPDTLQRLSEELSVLKSSLTDKGLTVKEMDVKAGKPSVQKTRLEQQLVDVHT